MKRYIFGCAKPNTMAVPLPSEQQLIDHILSPRIRDLLRTLINMPEPPAGQGRVLVDRNEALVLNDITHQRADVDGNYLRDEAEREADRQRQPESNMLTYRVEVNEYSCLTKITTFHGEVTLEHPHSLQVQFNRTKPAPIPDEASTSRAALTDFFRRRAADNQPNASSPAASNSLS